MTVADADRRERHARTNAVRRRKGTKERLSLIGPLFVLSLAIPLIFFVGPLRLSPYRILLILAFVPAFMAWIGGRAGPVRAPDILVLLASLWAFLGLVINHGIATSLESGGIYVIETFGAYLLARVSVRNLRSFHAVARTQFAMVVIMLPFAIIESIGGKKIVLDTFSKIGSVLPPSFTDPRWGFSRVQGAFEHPILYGVFCASALGLSVLATGHGRRLLGKLIRAAIVSAATFFSLSSGPLAALTMQFFFLGWNRATRTINRRWTILCGLIALAYLIIDVLSNRTPFHVVVSYLTFSESTGYGRIITFNYGILNVEKRPFFGTGLGDWDRLSWMSSSMDNFWLVFAVKYGLPMFLLMFLALILIVRRLSLVDLKDPALAAARAGLLVTIGGLAIAGATVHLWNATYAWFMFLLGSGMWLLDVDRADPARKPFRGRSGADS